VLDILSILIIDNQLLTFNKATGNDKSIYITHYPS